MTEGDGLGSRIEAAARLKSNQLCMDDRLKVAISAVLIAAMFVAAAGGTG